MILCPCDTRLAYVKCCGVLHAGAAATDARALMRSRYCAYVLRLGGYLLETWHIRTRPERLEFDVTMRWLGLRICKFEAIGPDHAQVEFLARCRAGGGRAAPLHEISDFVQEGGLWLYLKGSFPDGAT